MSDIESRLKARRLAMAQRQQEYIRHARLIGYGSLLLALVIGCSCGSAFALLVLRLYG